MTRENAKKLQSMMAKEAVTLLMLGGAEADTAEHEEAIRLIGEAGGLQRKRRPGKSNGSGTGGSPSEWERKICRRMKGTSRWYSQAGKS